MKKLLWPFSLLCATTLFGQKKDYPIHTVTFTQVKLTDDFWLPRIRTNHTVTIPASFERCESTGRVRNFEMAAAHSGKFCTTFPFDDTDIYKTIEGASYSLSLFPDKKMESYIDSLILKVARAQEPDGYLYTARTIDPQHPHAWSGIKRWEKERQLSHELYNAGHLYEAAAAHYYATGKKNLLDIALKNADLVCSVFGPDKLHVAPGHEVVEMGLVKLYRITGKQEYLQTASFFIGERGHYNGYDTSSKDPWKNGAYWQDDKPVTEQYAAEGHAVRAAYLYSAMADVAALTGDAKLLGAIDTIWENMAGRKIYVQGGTGAIGNGERFGNDYELPNATAYNETCAAIANVYWNYRMFLLHGDSKYMDLLEKILYNGLISGVGLDGKSFFYTNAMQIRSNFTHADMEAGRSGWFDCSCCPTNMTRLLPSIPGYMYAQKDDDIYVNLFANSNATLKIHDRPLSILQQNNYPWDGALAFTIQPVKQEDFALKIRIPGWARGKAMPTDLYVFRNPSPEAVEIKLNGKPLDYTVENGYAVIRRTWTKNDRIELTLPMEIKKVLANNPLLKDDLGKVALQRGPLMYCAEWKDNNGSTSTLILPRESSLQPVFEKDLLNGVMVLKGDAYQVAIDPSGVNIHTEKKTITAIPYYTWANRGKGEMTVWLPEKVKSADLITE